MGTDIHPAIEVRRAGVWTWHRGEEHPNRYYDPERASEWNKPTAFGYPQELSDRDYLKFAILGDVRNGYGFAGVATFTPLTPISSQRGLPPDTSIEDAEYSDDDTKADLGDHSLTWVTLQELLDYDWTQTLARTGTLTEREFLACLIEGRQPTSWSGGVSGGNAVTVTPTEYLALYGVPDVFDRAQDRTYDPAKSYYVQYDWLVPLADATSNWRPVVTEYLTDLIPEGGTAEDVRLVFGFDS